MKKIAILGAMEMEIQPILEKVGSYEIVMYANNKYYLATYNNKELIIAHSKIGKVFSTMTAVIMIEHFGAEAVLFTGIAGGLQGLDIGDMIAATSTVQHDIDITAFGYPFGKVPSSEIKIKTCTNLLKLAEDVAKKLNVNLKTGVIATGDQFIHSLERKKFVINEFSAKAIEMEGGSVNLVCSEMNIPSLVLRSISDTADGNLPDDFEEFEKRESKRAADFIIKLVDNL